MVQGRNTDLPHPSSRPRLCTIGIWGSIWGPIWGPLWGPSCRFPGIRLNMESGLQGKSAPQELIVDLLPGTLLYAESGPHIWRMGSSFGLIRDCWGSRTGPSISSLVVVKGKSRTSQPLVTTNVVEKTTTKIRNFLIGLCRRSGRDLATIPLF